MTPSGHGDVRRVDCEAGGAVEIVGPYEDGDYLLEIVPAEPFEGRTSVVITASELARIAPEAV